MAILHNELMRHTSKVFTTQAYAKAILKRAIKRYGVDLTDEQAEALTKNIDRKSHGSGHLLLDMPGPDRSINLTKEDLEAAAKEYEDESGKAMETALLKTLDELPKNVLSGLYKDAAVQFKSRRAMGRVFERNLRNRWADGLDRLEMLIMIAQEAGEAMLKGIDEEDRGFDAKADVHLIDALAALHVKACRAASEILCLLSNGFADGAIARWRSLHEITVIAMFLAERQADLPERYLRHANIERFQAARQYQEHCAAIGYDPFTQEEMDLFKAESEEETARYGASFKTDYGWAASAVAPNAPTFASIERSLDLDHWRPYYKMACHGIHAGSQGLFFSLGLVDGVGPILLAGASNAGLCDPGHLTAISMAMASTALLTVRPLLDDLVSSKTMLLLANDVGKAFYDAHVRLEAEIETGQRKPRSRKKPPRS